MTAVSVRWWWPRGSLPWPFNWCVVREYLAQFQGNEIVIALIFFCWLVFGGIGTVGGQGLPGPGVASIAGTLLALLSCLLAILAVGQVVAIRWLRDLVFIHGASVGFYATLGFVAVTLLPYALLVGFVLPYSLIGCQAPVARISRQLDVYGRQRRGCGRRAHFSLCILVHWLTPFQVLLAVHLPLLACLWRLESAFSRRSQPPPVPWRSLPWRRGRL
jgi:hypothetical protein